MLTKMGKGSFKCKDCGETFETFYTEGGIRAGINLPHCPKCGSGNTRKATILDKICLKRISVVYLLIFLCLSAFSQITLNEKRIYLVDVTASMEGKGNISTPDIFKKVKTELTNTINSINNPTTEIVIIPFTNQPHQGIKGTIKDKKTLLDNIQNLSVKPGDTNIADAWKKGVDEIDTSKINYLFLLTDGLHNCGPSKESLYQSLSEWGITAKDKYFFSFYVMLTPNAKEQPICNIVESTEQMWLIESMNVNVSFIKSGLNLKTNIKNKKRVKLYFTSNNTQIFNKDIDFSIQLDDNPFYKLANPQRNWKERYVVFDIQELKPLMELPLQVQYKLRIKYNKGKYPLVFFTPETMNFTIENVGVRKMTIREKK